MYYGVVFLVRRGPLGKVTERAQKRRCSQKTADFRRFTLSTGNSSIWRAQGTAENLRFSQENRRKPQIELRHLRSVTFSSALCRAAPVRLASVSVRGWNDSSGSGFRFRRFLQGGGVLYGSGAGFPEEKVLVVIFCGFLFSQVCLFSRNSLTMNKITNFHQTPSKSTCLCNAPSLWPLS